MSVFGKKGLKVENVISGFKNTGTFPIDGNKYKISRLDNVKLISYNLGKANGAPVDENGSPALTTENKSNQTNLVNTSDVDCSHLTSAIISSVVDALSPQVKKSCKKLPFSTELYLENFSRSSWCATPAQENKGQSCSTQPSCSTPTSQDTLNLLQQNAPPGFKYYITLELRETNSLEKVLKNEYSLLRNESVNSLLTFSIADLDDFNVGKCFAGILAKTKSLLLGKIAQSIFCWCWQSCSGSWNPVS